MPNENPMDKLRALLDQVNDQVAKIAGLHVVNCGFAPHDRDGRQPDMMQFTVAIDPEVAFAPAEQLPPDDVITKDQLAFRREQQAYDAQFQDLITGDKESTEQKQAKDISSQLREQIKGLRSDEGLGFDG